MKPHLHRIKRIVLLVIVFHGEIMTAFTQDPEFTQYYANQLYLNPAFAGSNRCPRFALNYRNQWPSLSGTYVTTSASFDKQFDNLNGGLGIIVLSDQAGENTLKTNSVNVMYSYNLQITRKLSVRFGAQAGYFQRSLDWDKLSFGDMIDARSGFIYQTSDVPRGGTKGNVDFSTGVLVYSDQFFGGLAVHHLTQPNESVIIGNSPLPRKITAHAGAVIPIAKHAYTTNDTKISPNILFRSQGSNQQLNLGLYVSSHNFVGGVWYRNRDSFIFLVGFQTNNIKFGYSYDLTSSKLTYSSGGSHELSLGLNFNCRPKKRTYRTISCPSF
jgi:type IX secretion system PorP/SprF family membrane protein